MPKCYLSELGKDDGRCENRAVYEAKLNWSNQPIWYLCEEHAAEERAFGNVEWIRSIARAPEKPHPA